MYLKNESVWEHKTPLNSTWQWLKMMEIKEEVKHSFKNQISAMYSIAKGYNLFLGQHQKLRWCTQIWSKWILPKFSFISWLEMLDRLQTKEQVGRFNNAMDKNCVFCCMQVETRSHLFFYCDWSKDCLEKVNNWLNWKCLAINLDRILRWIQICRVSKLKKNIYLSSLSALIYFIWKARKKNLGRKLLFS